MMRLKNFNKYGYGLHYFRDMNYRDLEKVRGIIMEATSLDVVYAYDDLVFPEHAAFMIQFDDSNENNFFCYFHKDCIGDNQKTLFTSLQNASHEKRCTLVSSGAFELKQKGEEIEINFL
jgi:hypothetical protein